MSPRDLVENEDRGNPERLDLFVIAKNQAEGGGRPVRVSVQKGAVIPGSVYVAVSRESETRVDMFITPDEATAVAMALIQCAAAARRDATDV